jgi:hypothetical protein
MKVPRKTFWPMQAKGVERTRFNEEIHRREDNTAFSTFLCLKGLQGFAT